MPQVYHYCIEKAMKLPTGIHSQSMKIKTILLCYIASSLLHSFVRHHTYELSVSQYPRVYIEHNYKHKNSINIWFIALQLVDIYHPVVSDWATFTRYLYQSVFIGNEFQSALLQTSWNVYTCRITFLWVLGPKISLKKVEQKFGSKYSNLIWPPVCVKILRGAWAMTSVNVEHP